MTFEEGQVGEMPEMTTDEHAKTYYGPKPGESAVSDIASTAEKREGYKMERLEYTGLNHDEKYQNSLFIRPYTVGGESFVVVDASAILNGQYSKDNTNIMLSMEQAKHLLEHLPALVDQAEMAPGFGEDWVAGEPKD